jgi:hypothetical protein
MREDFKKQLIKLGNSNPELRPHIRRIMASNLKEVENILKRSGLWGLVTQNGGRWNSATYSYGSGTSYAYSANIDKRGYDLDVHMSYTSDHWGVYSISISEDVTIYHFSQEAEKESDAMRHAKRAVQELKKLLKA